MMSRIVMASDCPKVRYTRKDYEADIATKRRREELEKAVGEWLKANPEIGVLNSGRYYVTAPDGEMVFVEPLSKIDSRYKWKERI